MSSSEFTEWIAYYQIHPHSATDSLVDSHSARLTCMIANMLSNKPIPLSKFMLLKTRHKKQTGDEMFKTMASFSDMSGAK